MVIALFGPKRSGKDTFARFLAERLSKPVTFFRFAEPLKGLVQKMMGLEGFDDEELKRREDPFFLPDKAPQLVDQFLLENSLPKLTPDERNLLLMANNKSIGEAYRYLLQVVGTEIIRQRYPNFFVRYISDAVRKSSASYKIILDGRFRNELQGVKRLGGFTIGLVRKHLDLTDNHLSEVEAVRSAEDCHLYFELDEGLEFVEAAAIKSLIFLKWWELYGA